MISKPRPFLRRIKLHDWSQITYNVCNVIHTVAQHFWYLLDFLDFGMMGEFKEELRDGFIEACLHLVNRDFDALAKDFVTLGYLTCCPVAFSVKYP